MKNEWVVFRSLLAPEKLFGVEAKFATVFWLASIAVFVIVLDRPLLLLIALIIHLKLALVCRGDPHGVEIRVLFIKHKNRLKA